MKKRLILFLAVTLICALSAFALVACGGKGGGSEGKSKVGGTYYLCVDDELDDSMYITFNNGTWTDDADETGSYTVTDNSITLYVSFDGEETEYAVGTVDGDDITLNIMGANVVYRKGEDIGNKPAEKTLEFVLNDDKNGYAVKGIGGLEGDIIIPAEYKRKPVTAIEAGAFKNRAELTSIIVGENVVSIGEKAFLNCTNLTAATLGERVETIEASTFEDCKKLARVAVPASVTRVEYDAFKNCDSLIDVYYTGSASDWAGIEFPYNIGSQQIQTANFLYATYLSPTGLQELQRKLYINDELLTDADLTECDQLNPFAFYRYKYLESATIGGTLTEIGAYAFRSCSGLETVTIQGGSLAKIGESAFDGSGITAVSLPESCRRIEQYAFNNCYDLYSVNVGNGVNYIGSGAFMGCDMLAELSLGNSVAEIKDGAFYGCFALESVTIPSSAIFIGESAFLSTGLTSATFGSPSGWKVKKVGGLEAVENLSDAAHAATLLKSGILLEGYGDYDWEKETLSFTKNGSYYNVNNVGTSCSAEIVIPETYNGKTLILSGDAFKGCKTLKSITIPACCRVFDFESDNPFGGCEALENITVSACTSQEHEKRCASFDGVLYAADYSKIIYIPRAKTEATFKSVNFQSSYDRFSYTNLEKVVIADGVTSIGDWAFNSCCSLTNITIPDSVISIGDHAFSSCDSLTNITIPDSVASIGDYAFEGCSSLTHIIIPDNVTSVGICAFVGCSSLKGVTIGDGVVNISGWMFENCDSLENVTIGNSVARIGVEAFYNCGALTDIVIPDSVVSIGESAFEGCGSLTKVTLGSGVTSIGNDVFDGCYSLFSIYIPISVSSIGEYAFSYASINGYGYGVIYCEAASKPVQWDDGWNYGKPVVWDCKNNDKDESGYEHAVIFGIHYALKDDKATVAMQQCENISGSVIIPASVKYNGKSYSVTNINAYAFYDCDGLTDISMPNSVTNIGERAFYSCDGLTSVTIPAGMTTIENQFESCSSLTSVIIPVSIKRIGDEYGLSGSAFRDCDALSDIYYKGTKAQWKKISTPYGWHGGGSKTIHCTDGDIEKIADYSNGFIGRYEKRIMLN